MDIKITFVRACVRACARVCVLAWLRDPSTTIPVGYGRAINLRRVRRPAPHISNNIRACCLSLVDECNAAT